MRIATLIIGGVLSIALFIQSLLVSALSDAANTEHDGADGAMGILMALMWLVAVGLVIPLPVASAVLFGLAGVIGLVSAGALDFPDLAYWGVVSLFLAGMSLFGWRGKRKKDAKEKARDLQLQQSLAAQQQMAAQMAYMQQQQAAYAQQFAQQQSTWPTEHERREPPP